ncbi:MAG: hypothetical protein ACRDOK_25215 [Streptosporangiaceae bacterium]
MSGLGASRYCADDGADGDGDGRPGDQREVPAPQVPLAVPAAASAR